MPYTSITISTANSTTPGNSNPIACNFRGGKATSVLMSFGGSSTVANDATIQYTASDLGRIASSLIAWQFLSSDTGVANNPGALATALHLASTTWFDVGFYYSFPSPVAGIRLGSSALSSTGGLGTITLTVIQGD